MDSVLAYATQVLLEQPGVAAVEALEIKRRWGRTRSVTARIRFHRGAEARDICRSAAQALAKQLGAIDVCLVIAVAAGETVSREATL